MDASKPHAPIRTRILDLMMARMQRTHDRRRASFFVGPPGIGKSTAIAAFQAANAQGDVLVTRIPKRGATGPQALQSMLIELRRRRMVEPKITTNTPLIINNICRELNSIAVDCDKDYTSLRSIAIKIILLLNIILI